MKIIDLTCLQQKIDRLTQTLKDLQRENQSLRDEKSRLEVQQKIAKDKIQEILTRLKKLENQHDERHQDNLRDPA